MIRFTNDQGKALVVSLVAIEEILTRRASIGDTPADILRNKANGDSTFRDTYELLCGYDDDGPPVEEPGDQAALIINQLKQRNPPEIIDTLVELIGNRYSRNILAGSTLSEIRGALLRNDELASLSKLRSTLSCGGCGHPFKPGGRHAAELVSLVQENNEYVFYCPRCVPPTQVSCSKGCKGGVVEVPTSVQKDLMKKNICATCAGETQVAAGGTAADLSFTSSPFEDWTVLSSAQPGYTYMTAPSTPAPSVRTARPTAADLTAAMRRAIRRGDR